MKRMRALRQNHQIVAAADILLDRARDLAQQSNAALATIDWREAIAHPSVDAVVIATTNDQLAPITLASVSSGKHVLVEKPAARNAEELRPVLAAAEQAGVCVQVGFNHRFHPALWKAKEIVDSGVLGPLMFIRGRYGHGGRVGYDREWRADPKISGGGELLDQGVHLIDLARWCLGEFVHVEGHAGTYFWNMPVDDNAFLCLRTAKNMFSFEIYGREGKLQIDGLGGSYGVERLSYYRMLPQMGPPETTIWEYPGEDLSWKTELGVFLQSIESGTHQGPGLKDALAALEIVGAIYQKSTL
jgi:predicted dehydrogenase